MARIGGRSTSAGPATDGNRLVLSEAVQAEVRCCLIARPETNNETLFPLLALGPDVPRLTTQKRCHVSTNTLAQHIS